MKAERSRTLPTSPDDPSAGDAHPRRHLIFVIVSTALFMSSIDQTIVATALPALHRDLHAGINWSGWTITVYALGRVIVMPLIGKVGDRLGRRRVFLLAIALFTMASLACGLANNIYLLVALRAVQAFGGGAFMPSATGIVADYFGRNRDRAVGLFTSIVPIGAIVGPILGGLFVTYWSWRGIFLVNVPIGAALIVLGLKYIPPGASQPSSRIDFVGILLLSVSLLAAMLGVTYLGGEGTSVLSPDFLVPEAVAVAGITLLLRHASRDPAAIIPMRLLRGRGFGVMNLINFLYGSAALGFGALVPLYAQQRYGMHALAAGTLLTARAVGMIGIAALAVLALRRTGYRLPMLIGFVISAAGLAMMAIGPASGMSTYVWLATAAAVTGVGMGLALPAANNASLQLDPNQVSAIAGLRSTFRQTGSIAAVSVTTAVLARSLAPGIAQGHIFLIFAAILVAMLPLIILVPEHRGTW
ncbi:MAG: MFS transporter [Sciscionella sp.]